MAENVKEMMENRIRIMPRGSVITPTDFSKLGSDNTIRQNIYKLAKEGILIALGNGIYKKKNFNEVLGKEIPVDPDQVAEAYARKRNWNIFPSKNLALNMLGLSTQVPNVYTYKSNGSNAEVQVANRRIVFEKVNPKNISAHKKSNIVIEAINYLGKENVTDRHLKIIRTNLSEKEMKNLLEDSKRSTIWIKELIREMGQVC